MIPTRRIVAAAALAAAATGLVAPTASAADPGPPAAGALSPTLRSLAADGLPTGDGNARTAPSTHLHRPDTRDQAQRLALTGLLSPLLGKAARS